MDGGGEGEAVRALTGKGPLPVEGGEFDGWLSWLGVDAFEDQSGPFYFREEAGGGVLCAFRAEARHMNGGGFMHGGCMMTFADFCLFAISHPVRRAAGDDGPAVTISINGEFAGSAKAGDLVECRGEVVRMGGSLIFLRGIVSNSGRAMLNFSGVIKKVKRRPV